MQLRYSKTSPYVRKVRVVAIETGLDALIDLVETDPHDHNTDLGEVNPLGKVPTLIADDGMVLFDSPVICEYLDSLHGGARVVPVATASHWLVQRMQSVGDGIMDAAVAAVMEGRRPIEEQSPGHIARQKDKINRAIEWLDSHLSDLSGTLNLGQISVSCALAYLDFRLADLGWRDGHDALGQWQAMMVERPSMKMTRPE